MKEKLLSLTLPGNTQITPIPGYVQTGSGGLEDLIQWVLRVLFIISVALALLFLLWGGVKWIISGGDKEKIASARKTILYAIIGIVIVLLSAVIVQFVGYITGADSPQNSRSSSKKAKPYDCPDGTNNYYCGRNTSDTQCPLCSPNPDCSVGEYSIAKCSVEEGKESFCTQDDQCIPNCPLGKRGVGFCNKPDQGFDTRGTCQSNCIDEEQSGEF